MLTCPLSSFSVLKSVFIPLLFILISIVDCSQLEQRTINDDMPPLEPFQNLKVHLVTFNVNSKSPTNVSQLFDFKTHKNIDIYAVSFQELSYTSIFQNSWLKECEYTLAEKGYVLLRHETMTVTSIMVFVRRSQVMEFYNIEKGYYNVDLLMRKGGVGVRFFWNSLSFCIIGSHLKPHDENYEHRNQNYHDIIQGLFFKNEKILYHDFIFWLGDLNYRFNTLNQNEITQFIDIANSDPKNPDRFKNLLAYDQLLLARHKHHAFAQFQEADINFAPTYKFVVGTHQYNEMRKPAFTDRILFRNSISQVDKYNDDKLLDIVEYKPTTSFTLSDHKPVRLVLNVRETADALKTKVLKSTLIRPRRMRTVRSKPSSEMDSTSNSSNTAQASSPEQTSSLLQPDQATVQSRSLRIVFESIGDWTENTPKTVRFKVVDRENGESVVPYPELFKTILTGWDFVGIMSEDWTSLDSYISFANPDFNFIEEAHEAADSDSEHGQEVQESPQDSEPHHTEPFIKKKEDPACEVNYQQCTPSSSNIVDEVDSDPIYHDAQNHQEYIYTAHFSGENNFIPAGRYQLLYFRANNDVIGMSEPFEIHPQPAQDFPA